MSAHHQPACRAEPGDEATASKHTPSVYLATFQQSTTPKPAASAGSVPPHRLRAVSSSPMSAASTLDGPDTAVSKGQHQSRNVSSRFGCHLHGAIRRLTSLFHAGPPPSPFPARQGPRSSCGLGTSVAALVPLGTIVFSYFGRPPDPGEVMYRYASLSSRQSFSPSRPASLLGRCVCIASRSRATRTACALSHGTHRQAPVAAPVTPA